MQAAGEASAGEVNVMKVDAKWGCDWKDGENKRPPFKSQLIAHLCASALALSYSIASLSCSLLVFLTPSHVVLCHLAAC